MNLTDDLLSAQEIGALTGKQPSQRKAQVHALRSMGIHHWVRPDGSPVVLRSSLVEAHGVRVAKPVEPDYGSLP